MFWFTVILDREGELAIPVQVYEKKEDRIKGLQVLVVDNNATNRFILSKHLRAWECFPVEVPGPDELLTILRESMNHSECHPDAFPSFDLILTDIYMPRTNGFELVRKIRSIRGLKYIPIIAITSAATHGDAKICREVGIDGYLPKPAKRESLYRLIELVMSRLATEGRSADGHPVTQHTIAETYVESPPPNMKTDHHLSF